MSYRYLRNHKEAVTEAVEQLWKHSYLTPANYTEIKNYIAEIESMIEDLKFAIKYSNDEDELFNAEPRLAELEAELKWFNQNVQLYNNTRISILEMHFTCDRPFQLMNTGYSNNSFFDFKKLVEQLNCYYGIEEPYKAPNKIAYGWNFCMEKGDGHYFCKRQRAYLFACIRNYLQKNDVDFKMSDIQKVVGLKDCEEGDE